ncbi:MAG: hypothetical protein ACXV5C_12095 [Halobacteriota archaeon]
MADGSSTAGFWNYSAHFTNSFSGTGVVCVPKEEVITLTSAIFVEKEVSVGLHAEAFWLVDACKGLGCLLVSIHSDTRIHLCVLLFLKRATNTTKRCYGPMPASIASADVFDDPCRVS